MSLYGPTFHVTPVDLGIIFQCKLYISCIMSCGNKHVSTCFNLSEASPLSVQRALGVAWAVQLDTFSLAF